MQLFLDTANVEQIREIHSWGVIAGVTTNPSLIAKEGRNFVEIVAEIADIVKGPVSAEVVAPDVKGMLAEGRALASISEHVVVKVPLSPEGLKVTKILSSEGIRTNVTLCFNVNQALLAGLAGATYISPFVGRVDDISWDGSVLIEQIVAIYEQSSTINTKVLAASIRHPLHLAQAALAGADVATLPFGVLQKAILHPLTDRGNEKFMADWATVEDRDILKLVEAFKAK